MRTDLPTGSGAVTGAVKPQSRETTRKAAQEKKRESRIRVSLSVTFTGKKFVGLGGHDEVVPV